MIKPAENNIPASGIRGVVSVLHLFWWAALAIAVARLFMPQLQQERGPDAFLLVSATVAVIGSASIVLPFQNVLWAALVTGTLAGVLLALVSMLPSGPVNFKPAAGKFVFGLVPWTTILLWIVTILSSRGTAKAILKPWRQSSVYGFWVMGLAASLVLVMNVGLEFYCSRIRSYWTWENWRGLELVGISPSQFATSAVLTLVVLFVITPMLINKKPGPEQTENGSAGVWIALNSFLAMAALKNDAWLPAIAVGTGIIAVFVALAIGRFRNSVGL
jgi:hypothetical protein